MKKIIIFLVILGLALAAFLFLFGDRLGLPRLGSGRETRDGHGCLVSASESWCEVKQKCLRTGEESCQEPLISDERIPTPKPRSQSK